MHNLAHVKYAIKKLVYMKAFWNFYWFIDHGETVAMDRKSYF